MKFTLDQYKIILSALKESGDRLADKVHEMEQTYPNIADHYREYYFAGRNKEELTQDDRIYFLTRQQLTDTWNIVEKIEEAEL